MLRLVAGKCSRRARSGVAVCKPLPPRPSISDYFSAHRRASVLQRPVGRAWPAYRRQRRMGKKGKQSSISTPAPAANDAKQSTGARPKRARGHRQKGAGTVVSSRTEREVAGMTIKEWQRTPMQLLDQYAQQQKRPRPQYRKMRADPGKEKYVLQLCEVSFLTSGQVSSRIARPKETGDRQRYCNLAQRGIFTEQCAPDD